MWYVVQTTNGQEDTAIEKCRQAIPVEVADKIFSPSYEGMRKYQGEWHIEINKLFPGYVFIQSENADQLETYLEHLSRYSHPGSDRRRILSDSHRRAGIPDGNA